MGTLKIKTTRKMYVNQWTYLRTSAINHFDLPDEKEFQEKDKIIVENSKKNTIPWVPEVIFFFEVKI